MNNINQAQRECNIKVSGLYFNSDLNLSDDAIYKIIQDIIDNYASSKVYIGITYHPCGRYTGIYSPEYPLPESINETYDFEVGPELINEVAHHHIYGKMYLVCQVDNQERIRDLEITMINKAKELNPKSLKNDSDGGGGLLSNSDRYFLYVCISLLEKI